MSIDKLADLIAALRSGCNFNYKAADALEQLRAERDDWARRFSINGSSPLQWVNRAERAEAERDAARALLKRAFPYVVNANVRFSQPEKLVSDIESALPTVWGSPDAALREDKP